MDDMKPKKLQTMFTNLSLKIENQFSAITKANSDWKMAVNADLEKFKKHYRELHGVLLNKFLVTLEGRVRLAEVNSITLVRLYVHKFYEMEKKMDPSFALTYEEYYNKLSQEMTVVSKKVEAEMEKEDAMAMEQEQKEIAEAQKPAEGESI